MFSNTIPKYRKIELILKTGSNTVGYQGINSTFKVEFEDCGLMITGDYIVVISDDMGDTELSLTSTGRIFHLNDVSAYKTYAQ